MRRDQKRQRRTTDSKKHHMELLRATEGDKIVLYILFNSAKEASLYHFLFRSEAISINGERRAYKIKEGIIPSELLLELL